MGAETEFTVRYLLSLRDKAIELEAPHYIREAEALLDRLHPEWRGYVAKPKKVEFKEPIQTPIQPLEPGRFNYIAQANAEDSWLDRR